MKKKLLLWQIAGFVFTGILGVLLHFLFDWSGQSIIVAPFSAVNESIWEHTKLVFFPMLIFALIQNKYGMHKNFWCIKLMGIVLGVISIPILYYTVNGALGVTPDWVNVLIFFVAAAVSYITELWLFGEKTLPCFVNGLVVLGLIALLFAVFTFIPPHVPLFIDPITKTYGF